jgi:hypothetical protein
MTSSAGKNPSESCPDWLRRFTIAALLVGVAWRTVRYVSQFPIWGDEAFVALNFLDRGYSELTQPLRFGQVAPVFFLWAELAAYRSLGGAEWSMRLLPFLAGLGGLALFWRLARSSLPPLGAAFAVAVLALSYYPIRHSCEIKPYGFDLLWSVALLAAAVAWLRAPDRAGPMILLAVLGPLAFGFSYPAVFIAGAIGLVILPKVLRRPEPKALGLYCLYVLAILAAFAALYGSVGVAQFQSAGGRQNVHWQEAFPPTGFLDLAWWFVSVHTGNMMAYPIGAKNGGSLLTTVFCLIGAWQLWRDGRRSLLSLCLLPLGLNLIAAWLHLYPYGTSARVMQHAAPAICILAGAGIATLIAFKARTAAAHKRWSALAFGVLLLIGVAGTGRDILKPHKTESDYKVRDLARRILAETGPDDQIVILDAAGLAPAFEWYLRRRKAAISWNGEIDPARLNSRTGNLWLIAPNGLEPEELDARLSRLRQKPVLASREKYDMHFGWLNEPPQTYELLHWKFERQSPDRLPMR